MSPTVSIIEALRRLSILDTPPEPEFDQLATLARFISGAAVALVGFADEEREWFKAASGWDVRELPLQVSLLHALPTHHEPTIVEDASTDRHFSRHPLVVNEPNIRFYACFPIHDEEGIWVGGVELLDRVPRRLNVAQQAAMATIAHLVVAQLSSRKLRDEHHRQSESAEEAREALRDSDERFRDLFDNVDDFIMTIAADGRLLHANQAWYEAIAATDEGHEASRIREAVHPDHRVDFDTVFERVVRTGEAEKVETVFLTNTGHRLTADGRLTPKVFNGQTILVRVIFRDITDRKLYEVELGRARDAALESARLKSQFLTNVSHEIRTPMNGIVGMMQLLLDSELNGEQKEFAQTALASADELLSIINNILQMSKLEAGRLSLTISDFDAIETVERVVEVMRVMAAGKSLTINVLLDPDLPTIVHGDVAAVRQILTNLLGNAVKFTEQGKIDVRVTYERETDTHQILRFEVSDTGIGIPEEAIPRLFQSFTQVDGSVTRKHGGVGLGLSTARQLVELTGGVLGVESRLLQGSKFWFTIPFEKRVSERIANTGKLDFTGVRVLVIDLSETSRKIITHYLESSLKMRCDAATSAVEALEMSLTEAALGDPYSVIIFDLHMPSMHGLDLAAKIRAERATGGTALIAMTSIGEQVDDEMLREVGISSYLSKPVEQVELLDALTLALVRQMRPVTMPKPLEAEATPPKLTLVPSSSGNEPILLAEDNLLNQKLTTSQLKKLGYDVEVVSNGREVIEALDRRPYPLILMDCQMPEMDGYQATMEIRRREAGERRIRIVAMTAHALEGDREKCLASGMDDYLAKPTKQEELAQTLVRWLGPRES
ncbi:MAG TPA: response regulator [Thermoanaerobaculia bacterium]|nr:response regulator [Thermoanaerobaculia bacterium]